MNSSEGRAGVWLLSLFLILSPQIGLAGEATEQLRASITKFVDILTKTPVAELREKGLPEAARKLVFDRFDFSEMTRSSLGKHWDSLQSAEKTEFVAAFTQRLLATYGRTVRSGGESIEFKQETRVGNRATVETEVVDGGQSLSIDYHLHDIAGQWKVYDVIIGDVSVVRNFQAQFERVIAKSSLRDLLQMIKRVDS